MMFRRITWFSGRRCWPDLLLVTLAYGGIAVAEDFPIRVAEIRVRDPFVVADDESATYYLYAQSKNRATADFHGVEVYTSRNLQDWSQPRPVMVLPENSGVAMVWAPEVHRYRNKYYLFVTLTLDRLLPIEKPVKEPGWPPMHVRGTHVYQSDSPLGPFARLKEGSHTPGDWMALDGTLYVEEGQPYMVFCHEWVQTIDGSIDYIRLKEDLSDTIGQPHLMLKASDAPGVTTATGKVTDGPFLYRRPRRGDLLMVWSTHLVPPRSYCVVVSHSESGKIAGPWGKHRVVFRDDGGHAMLFRTFEGQLLAALHQPNAGPKELLKLLRVVDEEEGFELVPLR